MKKFFSQPAWLALILTFGLCGCTQAPPPPVDGRAVAEAHVREESEKWWAAAKEKNVEQVIAFYAIEAQLLPPNAHIVRGRDDIRSAILTIMSTPQFRIQGRALQIEAASAGDIVWESGTFEIAMENPGGEVTSWPGKYVAIWKKRAGGQWRVISNIFNSDQRGAELTSGLN